MDELEKKSGFDLNATLSSLIGAYSSVSVARAQADAIKYGGAINTQEQTLNSPQSTKWAANSGTSASLNRVGNDSGAMVVPPALIYGGLALGLGFILLKAFK